MYECRYDLPNIIINIVITGAVILVIINIFIIVSSSNRTICVIACLLYAKLSYRRGPMLCNMPHWWREV